MTLEVFALSVLASLVGGLILWGLQTAVYKRNSDRLGKGDH